MRKVTIIFNNLNHTITEYDNVEDVIVHTYGFLELAYENGVVEFLNMSNIFSFKDVKQ